MSQTINTNLTVLADAGQSTSLADFVNPSGNHTIVVGPNGDFGYGIQGAPGSSTFIPFWVSNSFTDKTANAHGFAVTSQRNITTTPGGVTQTTGLLLQTVGTNIATGINDPGRTTAISTYGWRDNPSDAGQIDICEGMEFIYGHGSQPNNSIVSTNVYGMRLVPCVNSGTISNLYDVFITSTQKLSVNSTLGAHFAIYQQDTTCQNYFGSVIDAPTVRLRTGANLGYVWTCTDAGSGSGSWQAASGSTGPQGPQGPQGAAGGGGSSITLTSNPATALLTSDGASTISGLANVTYASGTLQVTSVGSSATPLAIKAANAQAAGTLFEIRNNSGTALVAFDFSGYGFPRDYSFTLGGGASVAVGTDLTNHINVTRAGKIKKAFINAKTGPVGADLIVDIKVNGTSIWATTTSNRLKIANGATTGTQVNFDTTLLNEGDLLSIDVVQVGSSTPGSNVTVTLLALLKNQ